MALIDNGETITDDSTGLMWEKKLSTGSGNGLREAGYKGFWSEPNTPDGQPNGTAFTEFLAFMNLEGFAGYRGWRLPTRQELLSIVDRGQTPAINPLFGPTQRDYYWTNDTYTEYPYSAWAVNFGRVDSQRGFPEVQSGSKYNGIFVRAVRNI